MTSELEDDQIRLVSILDAGPNLHVSNRHIYTLPATPAATSYIALSYVWGSSCTQLRCDDTTLTVSTHLPAALRQLHAHHPTTPIWTDSVSIDQTSAGEKAHQVGMMGRIFASAQTVAVWFGPDDTDVYTRLTDPVLETDDDAARSARVALLKQIAEIPWFYRAWTFQEIRLARDAVVMLGANTIPWPQFLRRIQTLRAFEPRLSTVAIRSQPRGYSRFTAAPTDQFFGGLEDLNAGHTGDLAGLLFATWYREASVRHDKVYSLLSDALFEQREHGIDVDYGVAWSALCVRVARACLNTGSSLKVLRVAGMKLRWKSGVTNRWDREEVSHLLAHPSWAPDWWSPPQQLRSSASLAFDERGVFAPLGFVCPETPPVQTMDDISPFLVLNGVVLGIINIGDPPSYHGGPTLIHPPPRCADRMPLEWIKRPEPVEEAKLLQGVCRVYMPSFIEDVQRHLHGKCSCVPFHERLTNGSGFDDPPDFHDPSRWEQVQMKFDSLSCFSLDFKNVGGENVDESSVPAQVLATSVESGDWLVLLEGGGAPFVLRPIMNRMGNAQRPEFLMSAVERAKVRVSDGAGCFVLVGEASMCWDQLWPGKWDMYCRAGNFVLI